MAATASAALRPKDYKSDLKPVWCPGCGDFAVLAAITKALSFLELPREDVALITDDDNVYYLTGYYDYLHMDFGRPTVLVVTRDGSMPSIAAMALLVEPSTTRLSWISESTMLAGGNARARV